MRANLFEATTSSRTVDSIGAALGSARRRVHGLGRARRRVHGLRRARPLVHAWSMMLDTAHNMPRALVVEGIVVIVAARGRAHPLAPVTLEKSVIVGIT